MLSSFPSQTDVWGSFFVGCEPFFAATCSLELCNQAAESYLKDLPFYRPPTFIFKDRSKAYLSVIQFALFFSLLVCKYNDLQSEKHCYLIYKRNCNVHVSHGGQLGVKRACNIKHVPKCSSDRGPVAGLQGFLRLLQEAVIFITPNNLNKNIQISSEIFG